MDIYQAAHTNSSPPNGSFVPLMRWKEGLEGIELMAWGRDCFDPKGYYPPHGIFVEFEVVLDFQAPKLYRGITAQLGNTGPQYHFDVVFVTGKPYDVSVFSFARVSKWRELTKIKDITPDDPNELDLTKLLFRP